jgi:Ca2+-binding EF-hand superfamily protein
MDDDHEDENDPSNGIIAQSLPPGPVPNGVSDRQLPPAAASLSSLNRSQHQSMRPMFEVIAPHGVIVREKIETASREVCTLPYGSKVIVVDARRNGEGAHRVCIKHPGVQNSLGWITAKKQERGETNVMIKEITEEASHSHEPPGSHHRLVTPLWASTPPASARGPSTGRDLPGSSRGSARGLGWSILQPWGARATPSSASGSHSSLSDSRYLASARGYGSARASSTGSLSAREIASARGNPLSPSSVIFHSSTPGTPGFTRRQFIIDAAKTAREAAEASFRASRSGNAPGFFTGRSASSASSEEPKAPRAAHSPKLSSPNKAKRGGKVNSASLLITSAALEGIAVNLQQQADTLEKRFGLEKTVAILLGEVLSARNVKLAQMVKQLAKNGEDPISKMEFRQRVRKLLPKVDTIKIDALFVEWDKDGGGSLDVDELKDALRQCCESAAKYAELSANARSKITRLQERMAQAREAAAAMAAVENANVEIERISAMVNTSTEFRLGTLLLQKASSLKMSDIVRKWDANGDGKIDPDEFRLNVKKLGLVAPNFEIDRLFRDLDVDNGGDLDEDEVKQGFRDLMESASRDAARQKELRKTLSALVSSASALQAELRKRNQEEEAAAIQEEKEEAARQAKVATSAKVMANVTC